MNNLDSDYEVRLATLAKMGGDTATTKYDSVFEVDLAILNKTGEGGGSGVQVVQTTGTSTTAVMSQNAVTEALADAGDAKQITLTQAEYDALTEKDANTLYIISDAPAVDMNNYYTKVESDSAIALATENKATKSNISASNGWPAWNKEGVITGQTYTLYRNSNSVNGSTRYSVQTNNSSYSIYAPTSVGSSGNILKSNGSGAPSWVTPAAAGLATTTITGGVKIVQITESDYEALTTKDANTLYLVTD